MKKEKFSIISKEYYSNCLIEAVKAKLKDRKVSITFVSPFDNEEFCPHFLWSDGEYDYDFGWEHRRVPLFFAWTLHRGHIRRRALGYNERYKNTCKRWKNRHKKFAMTYEEFEKWYKDRITDGHLDLVTSIYCLFITETFDKIPENEREKVWQEDYRRKVVQGIVLPLDNRVQALTGRRT
jgi:hypothetical protein